MAGFPDTIEQSIRWIPAKNVGRFTVPAFGLVGLRPFSSTDTGDNGTFAFKWDAEHGRYLEVTRPTSHHQILQHATHVAVAGPEDILPGRFGRVSKDWPLPVRTTGGSGTAIGTLWGPLADEFRISDVGTAFRVMSFDPVPGIDFALVWIEPSLEVRTSFHIGHSDSTISVSAGGELHRVPAALTWSRIGSTTLNVTDDSKVITAQVPGVYSGTFEMLARTSDVEMPTFIGATMYRVDKDGNESESIYRGRRQHATEYTRVYNLSNPDDEGALESLGDSLEQIVIPFAILLMPNEGLHITADEAMTVARRRWILSWNPFDVQNLDVTATEDAADAGGPGSGDPIEDGEGEDSGGGFVPSIGRGVGLDVVGSSNIVG